MLTLIPLFFSEGKEEYAIPNGWLTDAVKLEQTQMLFYLWNFLRQVPTRPGKRL